MLSEGHYGTCCDVVDPNQHQAGKKTLCDPRGTHVSKNYFMFMYNIVNAFRRPGLL